MNFFPIGWQPVEQPTVCVDDLIFGKSSTHPLPLVFGYHWIDQIDGARPPTIDTAVEQFLAVVQAAWKTSYGQRYVGNYDENLTKAMEASKVASLFDKQDFDEAVAERIGNLLNVGGHFEGIDMALQITAFGIVASKFDDILATPSILKTFKDILTGAEKIYSEDSQLALRDALETYSKAVSRGELSLDHERVAAVGEALERTRDFLEGHPFEAGEFDKRTQALSAAVADLAASRPAPALSMGP